MIKTGVKKLDEYCEGVKSGEIDVCGWIKKAVDRHYRDLAKVKDIDYPYYFDKGACEHYVNVFETKFKHYEGVIAGSPVIFEPWQWFVFGSPFGWMNKKTFHGTHIRRFRRSYVFIPKKNGKALDVDTDIPTPHGWVRMGDIKKGDKVFDENGNPCNVIEVTDIQKDRPCYKLTFSDGSEVIADENHEWVTSLSDEVVTTKYLSIKEGALILPSQRQIVSVEKVDNRDVKCIQVDSESNMYLCGRGFVETHNSIISGGTAIYMMDYDGWNGAQCYIMAESIKHARDLGYRAATSFVENNSELSGKYKINRSAADTGIYFAGNNNAFYKPITKKVKGEDGRNVHFFGPDETKDWTDDEIFNLMVNGTVNAPNSLILCTTTSGSESESLGKSHQEYLEKILDEVIEDETVFGAIYTIDDEDKLDENGEFDEFYYENPKLWAKANPNYNVSVYREALEGFLPNARQSVGDRIAFQTKHLNIWHTSTSSFIKPEIWNECDQSEIKGLFYNLNRSKLSGEEWQRLADREIEDYFKKWKGYRAIGGLDLGFVSDFTSLVIVVENIETGLFDVIPLFWIPEDTMKDRKNAHLINRWIQQGFIQTTAGATTDHNFIEYTVKKISEHIGLGEIWLDRTKADILITNLSNFGIEMVKFGQGYASMSSAVDIMEKLTLDRKINYGKNPVLRWMNGNTVIQQDPAGNRKFNKDKAQDKIDGIVASAMALTGIYLGEETEESIYNERGAIFF